MDDILTRYNYDSYKPENFEQWDRFDESPKVGETAPDFPLWNLDQAPLTLHQILAQNQHSMIEFGSFSEPYCGISSPDMNAVAERYKYKDVGSFFIYTHEVHPGENIPHLTSMQQKFEHAEKLRDDLGVKRPILVDALDGACHRAFGSMPNMTWIFDRSGVVLYKADWTDSHSVQNALEYIYEVTQRKQGGEKMKPFRVERLGYRSHDRHEFYRALGRNGQKAVQEFEEVFPDK